MIIVFAIVFFIAVSFAIIAWSRRPGSTSRTRAQALSAYARDVAADNPDRV